MYKYAIFGQYNLILVKWKLGEDDDFADAYQQLGEDIYSDPGYMDGLNIITDFRDTSLPDAQLYYNDMTKKINLKGNANISVRLLDENSKSYKQLLDIFSIFYKGDRYLNSVKTVFSLSEAFAALELSHLEDELKSFFESY